MPHLTNGGNPCVREDGHTGRHRTAADAAVRYAAGKRYTSSAKGRARTANYKKTPKGKITVRRGHLKAYFNITLEQYNALLESQDGACYICRSVPEGNLTVDHDHGCCPGRRSCGRCVRGLLCHGCNRLLLGHIDRVTGHDAERVATALERAAAYVRNPPARGTV